MLRVLIPPRPQRFNPHPRAGVNHLAPFGHGALPSFNPHPRAGVNKIIHLAAILDRGFNPHPRAGVNPKWCVKFAAIPACFNPHPRAGVNLSGYGLLFNILAFQSPPPCGGEPRSMRIGRTVSRFQSPPPCGGERGTSRLARNKNVSIPTPVRG